MPYATDQIDINFSNNPDVVKLRQQLKQFDKDHDYNGLKCLFADVSTMPQERRELIIQHRDLMTALRG